MVCLFYHKKFSRLLVKTKNVDISVAQTERIATENFSVALCGCMIPFILENVILLIYKLKLDFCLEIPHTHTLKIMFQQLPGHFLDIIFKFEVDD